MRCVLAVLCFCLLALVARPGLLHAETLRWMQQSDVQTLDPYGSNETATLNFLGNIYEGLIRRDQDLVIRPALAERWEQLSPTRWRFHLRRDVRFHNGNAFTADDVVFSLARVRSEGSDVAGRIPTGTEIEKIDDFTVEFTTPKANPRLIAEWASWLILDREWAEENGAEQPTLPAESGRAFAALNANGTGPFRVVERLPGERTRLAPFAGWWGEPTHNLTEVIFLPEPDGQARVKALLEGEVDLIQPVPVVAVPLVNDSDGASVMTGPELRTIFLGMDQEGRTLRGFEPPHPNPFLDQRVREAVYLAIDVDRIKKRVMRNLSTPAAMMISPFLYRPPEAIKRPSYNPERARALLAQAGYAGGLEVPLDCPRDRYLNDEALCNEIAAMLGEVGIEVRLRILPKSEFFEKVLAPDYDTSFYLFGWLPTSLEPYNVIHNLFLCREPGARGRGRFNIGGYCNEKVDALGRRIESSLDADERAAMIAEVFLLAARDWAYVPLHQQGLAWGLADGVELPQRADDLVMLWRVRIN